ncbi:MAG: AAA family ATPase [Oscillochloris sp.]|nr:AAA family ATPase [Oscillochloris sp.]
MVTLAELAWLPHPPAWQLDWPTIMAACPWLAPLAATPQDPAYHAEGDVLTHTRMVAESLVGLAGWRARTPGERAALLLAALLHDIGKPPTTQIAPDGRISSPGHSLAGAAIARSLLWGDAGLGGPLAFAERELVAGLVRFHGLPHWFLERSDIARGVLPPSLRIPLDLLALLAEADLHGRISPERADLVARVDLFRDWCAEQGCLTTPYPFPSDHSRVRYCRRHQRDPAYHAYDDTWGEVTLLAGLPGAGKDTWLHKHAGALPLIALDTIRAEREINPEDAQGAVVSAAKDQARALLRRHQPFIWNATNLTRRLRDPLVDLMLGYGARVRIVYLDAPLPEVLRRNRQRAQPVPEAVILRLATRAEPPDLSEAHRVEVIAPMPIIHRGSL